MTNREFALAYLKAVERKYKAYFESSEISMADCVAIKGGNLISVYVIKNDLPIEIRRAIESMFWIE